jgi:hypothetical protein
VSQETLTLRQCCELADRLDPSWYFDWCEREGTEEELRQFVSEAA